MNQHNIDQLRPVFGRIGNRAKTMNSALVFWGLYMMLLASLNRPMAQSENRGLFVNLGNTVPDFILPDLDGRIHSNETLLRKHTCCD